MCDGALSVCLVLSCLVCLLALSVSCVYRDWWSNLGREEADETHEARHACCLVMIGVMGAPANNQRNKPQRHQYLYVRSSMSSVTFRQSEAEQSRTEQSKAEQNKTKKRRLLIDQVTQQCFMFQQVCSSRKNMYERGSFQHKKKQKPLHHGPQRQTQGVCTLQHRSMIALVGH